jgi:hypothetical protein
MSLSLYQRDYAYCRKRASDWLGQPVCALLLPCELEELLRKRVKLEDFRGFGVDPPLVEISEDCAKGEISVGMEMYRLRTPKFDARLVHVVLPSFRGSSGVPDFWAVSTRDYESVRRYVRRLGRRSARTPAPIMLAADRDRLWQNTVGFLLSSSTVFRQYAIAKKRGALLVGAPGNGKTMACRWLFGECRRHGLRWRNVTVADYEEAREHRQVNTLFHLDRPGIVLFDDLDFGIRNRETSGASADHSTFLAELDGVAARRSAIYLFTSNARLIDLDPAFRRPGRIDVVMEFRKPSRALRARYIDERWQDAIRAQVDVEAIISITEGLSFADLEELRKLLVLRFVEQQVWDWQHAWRVFHDGRGTQRAEQIGFGAKFDDNATTVKNCEIHAS